MNGLRYKAVPDSERFYINDLWEVVKMDVLMIREKRFAGNVKETIPKVKGGGLILKLNLFALNVTVSVQKARMTAARYRDAQRIRSMQEDLLTRRLSHSRFIR